MYKTSIAENLFEKVWLLNCNLWSLQKPHFQKQQNVSYLSPKEKKYFTGTAENTFLCNVDTYLKLLFDALYYIFCLKIVILDLSQPRTSTKEKEKTEYFWI